MQQRIAIGLLATVLALTLALAASAADKPQTWTGEVLDLACYVARETSKGADHADCAKSCVKSGQPMGLLTADGAVLLLAADHADTAPYEALKELAGGKAEVTGRLNERGGMKVVTVTGAKAAT